MSILTPNMGLYQPSIGIDSGLTWEQDINSNSTLLDQHNHSAGSGVQVNPSGININSDLPFNSNNSIQLRSDRFSPQSAPLSLASDIGCIYVSGLDLYFNDISGNQIRITSGGLVNATSSGISSGTASASFVSSVLVVDSASNTPASIQSGSLIVGNSGVSGSKYVTVSPPSALAANYSLTLPVVSPSGTQLLVIDPSGNMAPNAGSLSSVVANAIAGSMTSSGADTIASLMDATGANAIGATMTSAGANSVASARTRPLGTSVGAGGIATSSSSGSFTTSSTTAVAVTNLSVTIVTSGRPVKLTLVPIGTSVGTPSVIGVLTSGSGAQPRCFIDFLRSATLVQEVQIGGNTNAGTLVVLSPPSAASATDLSVSGAPGTYTYSVSAYVNSGASATALITNCALEAYEL